MSRWTYNRLDRSPIEIARVAIEEENTIIDSGFILVRKTSDGTQGTYDVRRYGKLEDKPSFLKGKIFQVTDSGLRQL